MTKRQIIRFDSALAALLHTVERLTRRLILTAPTGRPAGGPVVFRHYL